MSAVRESTKLCYHLEKGASALEEPDMAKGQMKSSKEKKKPKAETPKAKGPSAYQSSMGKGGPAANPFAKKS